MFKTLEIKNFKSIGHAQFDLGKINVLTGHSNLGKSNVVQAIYCLTHNHWDSNYLKWGTKSCAIKLTDETGEWVEYRHSETSAEYTLSTVDTPFTKIGRDVPQPVRDFLKMNCIQFDEDLTLDFNFERQFDPSFVISLSGFELAKVFGKLMNLDIVLSAARNINKDLGAIRKNIEGKEAIEQVSIDFIQQHYAIELKYALLHQAIKLDQECDVLDQKLDSLKSILCDLEYTQECANVYGEFLQSDAARQIDQLREPIQGLDTVLTGLFMAQDTLSVYNDFLSKPIPSFDFDAFLGLSTGLYDLALETDKKETANGALQSIDQVDFSIADQLLELSGLLGSIDQWNVEATHEHSLYDNKELEIQAKTEEFNQFLVDNNVCPISGKPFMEGCVENILASV